MTYTIGRRGLLKGAGKAAIGLTAFNLAGGSIAARAQTSSIVVTHFGGPYEILGTIVGAPFKEASGIDVSYEVEISPSAFAKIQTQKDDPPFDLVMVSRAWGLRALKTGLLAPVSAADFSEAPNLVEGAIPAEGWGAATMLDTFDLMVDTNQITDPVTSWLDLWREDMKGKIMLPSAVNGASALNFLVCLARAISGDTVDDASIDEAFKRLIALKPDVRAYYQDGAQPNMLIERGDIGICPQFGIRIANTSRATPNVVKASPKEGVLAAPYDLCMPANGKNPDAAKEYINFTLTLPVQKAMTEELLATPVRADVEVSPEVAPLVTTDPSLLWFLDQEMAAAKQRAWLDRYTREVQS
ncbi:ABC transporter substrate-binding protein [Acuticoccus kandeliae]|uniref:ABC transporter substrate-binding protein n=1 Tax=Acuticoccus kandeliae TaxID=2073160 RepID=UPI0013002789|nr:extracellular solute-binding protein [Acuticoccus kandeliae]